MYKSIPDMFRQSAERYAERPAFTWKEEDGWHSISYARLARDVAALSSAFFDASLAGKKIGIFSENCLQWMICDLAVQSLGGCTVPRGVESSSEELNYIIKHAGLAAVVVQDVATLRKIEENWGALTKIVILEPQVELGLPGATTFQELLSDGRASLEKNKPRLDLLLNGVNADKLATILYTSGTTGKPKGAALTHANILHNVRFIPEIIPYDDRDIFFSMLPIWHVFEQAVEYVALAKGACTAYSSKWSMREDLLAVKPTIFTTVPLVWGRIQAGMMKNIEKKPSFIAGALRRLLRASASYSMAKRVLARRQFLLKRPDSSSRFTAICAVLLNLPAHLLARLLLYRRLHKATGGGLRYGISGGAALAPELDDFYEAAGFTILQGWGLTETSPVLTLRSPAHNIPYSSGRPLAETDVKVVDEAGKELGRGKYGRLQVKGTQIMTGYYRDNKETKKVLKDGWFSTGDLGVIGLDGDVVITGRIKDTIVLGSGENIEPQPIEDKLERSPFISQAMLLGQDQRLLGALIVPEFESLTDYLKKEKVTVKDAREIVSLPRTRELVAKELRGIINERNGFKSCEHIGVFHLLADEFTPGEELTLTMKKRRHAIADKYKNEISALFER